MIAPAVRRLLFAAAFVLLATANSAGYRYGASDQAFYIPAVLRHVDPALFPRDAALIDSQARLTVIDEAIALLVRLTHAPLPRLFLALYLLTLVVLLAGAMRLARHVLTGRWSLVALGAALTLRHAVAKTGANTLEGYFHPRELAFALGVWAIASWIERRSAWCVALLLMAAAVHSTTALWFVILLGVATIVRRRPSWPAVSGAAVVLAIVALGATITGPLSGRLVTMDAAWLAVIAQKDYLFPLRWPADAWLTNLVTVVVIFFGWRARVRRHRTFDGEGALVAGAIALAVVFFAWLPFNAAHVALAVQLQVSRLFWVLDFLATIYAVWALAEGLTPNVHTRPPNGVRPQIYHRRALLGSDPNKFGGFSRTGAVALVLFAFSITRGIYSQVVQFPDRRLFAVDIANPDWRDAMAWAQSTPPDAAFLADPLHAARYGSSLRAAGHRDVFIEEIKDSAIAMYDRTIAMRVADRKRALADHPWDTVDGAQALARDYDLDYLVIDRALPLVEAHRSGSLHIYRLR